MGGIVKLKRAMQWESVVKIPVRTFVRLPLFVSGTRMQIDRFCLVFYESNFWFCEVVTEEELRKEKIELCFYNPGFGSVHIVPEYYKILEYFVKEEENPKKMRPGMTARDSMRARNKFYEYLKPRLSRMFPRMKISTPLEFSIER